MVPLNIAGMLGDITDKQGGQPIMVKDVGNNRAERVAFNVD